MSTNVAKLRQAIAGQCVHRSFVRGPEEGDSILAEAGVGSRGVASNEVEIKGRLPAQ
jgi:hypothetical protein